MRRFAVALTALALLLAAPLSSHALDPPDRLWSDVYGSGVEDVGTGVAVDAAGNSFTCGEARGAFHGQTLPGTKAFTLIKHDADGNRVWTRIHGPAGSFAEATAVATDGSGGVYVVGQVWATLDGEPYLNNGDLLLVKYDTSGTRQWTRIWGSSTIDAAFGVTVDDSGNIFVTGYTTGSFDAQPEIGDRDHFLTKFDSSGTRQWSRIWGGIEEDQGESVAVDHLGNIYVAGLTWGAFDGQTFGGTNDACLTKFDSTGTKQWTRLWGGSGINVAHGVDVDAAGVVYVAGHGGSMNGQTSTGSTDAFLIRVASDGTTQGTTMWGSIFADYGYAVAVGPTGDIFVGGQAAAATFDGIAGFAGAYVTRLDSAGAKLWTTRWGTSSTEVRGLAHVDQETFVAGGVTFGAFDGGVFIGEEDQWTSRLAPHVDVPVIMSGPTVVDVTHESARVVWTTDIAADSVVDLRAFGVPGTTTTTDLTEVVDHSMPVTLSLPGVTYEVRAHSTAASGGTVSSGWVQFVSGAPPPTDNVAIDLVRGRLYDVGKTNRDRLTIKVNYTLDQPGAFPFVPERDTGLIRIRTAAPDLDIPIPPDDPGWKSLKKGTKLRWKSAKGVLPKVKLIVDLRKSRMTLSVSKTEFGAAIGTDVGFDVVLGDARGSLDLAWRERKPGRIRYP